MNDSLPTDFRSDFIDCDGLTLHVVHNGAAYAGKPLDDQRQPILMLHGFPEFWIAWQSVMAALGDEFLIIVPDQRGYNLSAAPKGAENYKARLLVGDMITLMEQMIGERSFSLAGHDWGGIHSLCFGDQFCRQGGPPSHRQRCSPRLFSESDDRPSGPSESQRIFSYPETV